MTELREEASLTRMSLAVVVHAVPFYDLVVVGVVAYVCL